MGTKTHTSSAIIAAQKLGASLGAKAAGGEPNPDQEFWRLAVSIAIEEGLTSPRLAEGFDTAYDRGYATEFKRQFILERDHDTAVQMILGNDPFGTGLDSDAFADKDELFWTEACDEAYALQLDLICGPDPESDRIPYSIPGATIKHLEFS